MITIGKFTYGQPQAQFPDSGADLIVGKFCSFADGVKIFMGGNHRPDWVTTYPFNVRCEGFQGIVGHPATNGNVIIGNDVWVGQGAVIMSGVNIGDGAVIGAYSVVSRDVPPYAIYAGNPAVHRRYRFDQETVKKLLEIRWWDWDEEKIAQAIPLLQSDRLEEFFRFAEREAL